tara:strand:+ start:865 stop:1644 length:780 start_codon:yes stop_codon:yes gene_type:complete
MFITTNHRGGIGNVLFKLSAVISLAKSVGYDFIFPTQFLRPNDPDFRLFSNNILRNINFIPTIQEPYEVWSESEFHYTEIPVPKNSNLLLDGHFQSEKYFKDHKQFIIDLFKPTLEFKNQILEWMPNINECVSIHIRRGDYLNFPNHHPQLSESYFKEAVNTLDSERTFLIFSDDIEWCKANFSFIKNKYFIEGTQDWVDMYLMSLCGDNIIANSSFSWWGAYLNENPSKQVIAPSTWFGSVYSHWNTKDLYPEGWIKL